MNIASLRLCLVTDRSLSHGRSLVDVVGAALRGGITMVQLREKTATTREFLEEARALKALLTPHGIPLIINDRTDIALAVDAEGVHVGQKDMPVALVRAMLGPGKIIGLSITNRDQLARPDAALPDYLGMGPLYAQSTKADASTPLGVEGFRTLRAATTKPVIAIGGLKAENAAPVLAAGADGLAVVSAIVGAEDVKAATAAFTRLKR
jgi:thiamine-phosphate pyrophosphorylase